MFSTITKRVALALATTFAATHLAMADGGWEYKDYDSARVSRSQDLEQQANQGWQLRSLTDGSRAKPAAIMVRAIDSKSALKGEYQYLETSITSLPARLTEQGAKGWNIVTIGTHGSNVIALLNKPRTTNPLDVTQYEFATYNVDRTGNVFELTKAGHDGWEAIKVLQIGNNNVVLTRRDRRPSATVRKADYQYKWERFGTGDPTKAVGTATGNDWDLVDIVVTNRTYEGLLIRRMDPSAGAAHQYLWREFRDNGTASYIDDLNTLGKDGWYLKNVTSDRASWLMLFEK